jgi:hypothetical protein
MKHVTLRHQIFTLAGFITFAGVFLLFAQSARAATITVTNNLDSGSGSLRQAVLNASPGDRIVFSPAAFNHAVTITLNSQIEISKPLTIDGSAGNVVTPTLDGNNFQRILLISPNSYVVLNRLNFVRGHDTDCPICNGGAIHNEGVLSITASTFVSNTSLLNRAGAIFNSGTFTISASSFIDNQAIGNSYGVGGAIVNQGQAYVLSSTFEGNDAYHSGGALLNGYDSSLIVVGSVFRHNYAGNYGAGIFNYGSLVVSNSTFSNNESTSGGGISSMTYSTLTVTNSSFTNNRAYYTGGGIDNFGGTAKVVNSTFSGNRIENGDRALGGAGLYSVWGNLSIIKSAFIGNCVANASGAGILSESDVKIESSNFVSNRAPNGDGGGIRIVTDDIAHTALIANSTFVSNSASFGGGISSDGSLNLVNSSLVNNSADGVISMTPIMCDPITQITNTNQSNYGGGISSHGAIVTNTLLANNTTGGNCATDWRISFDGGHNLEDANTCGFTHTGSLTNTNPLLGPLSDAGFSSIHPLLPGSPAIDAGDDAACPATDIRGFHRPTGAHCDIGAYEYINLDKPIYLPIAMR